MNTTMTKQKVWCVFDRSYAPGPCPLLFIGSTHAAAESFIVYSDDASYKDLWLITEWVLDDE